MTRRAPDQLDLPLRFARQQAVGRAHLALEGRLVTYTIKRSARRRAISILVDEAGVRVGAPWNATHTAIERLLQKHAGWVLDKLEQWHAHRRTACRWRDGDPLMLLGEPFTLRLAPSSGRIGVRGSELIVAADDPSESGVSQHVHAWLQGQALRCFEERVAYFCQILQTRCTPKVLLSNARTRWGSCHASGRIHLNWRLIQMPPRLIDYVVAHEVAHLLEMNHSAHFWRAVARAVPDFAARRKELRREGPRYLLI